MLLRFSVANFGSIRDEQQLSMIASPLKDEPSGLIDTPALRSQKVLPAAVIYGANASGKSNLVRALAHMKELVRNSHRRGEPGAPISLKPFLLDPTYATKPSVFAIDFVWKDTRYAYRFEAFRNEFTHESLHVWRDGPVALLFERERQIFKFGRSLKGRNKVIEALTRTNSLFLSAAVQNNHEELTEINQFFSLMKIDLAEPAPASLIARRLADQGVDEKSIAFLRAIDSGITEARVDEMTVEKEDIEFRDAFVALLQKFVGPAHSHEVKSGIFDNPQLLSLGHQTTDKRTVFLDMSDESAGTVQMLATLGEVFSALEHGCPVIIDEFGSRLHTRASELVLSLFASKETNPKGAQLIVTTHDTNLLNAPGLRRDQIWFTEKDAAGATHLYPLTDIETRKGDNLEKGYLQGRFGAIPFAAAAADLLKRN